MLTRQGWGVSVGALALIVTGRILGVLELYVLAAGAWALVGTALVCLALRPAEVEAGRSLAPARVPRAEDASVELSVKNTGRRSSAVIELRDPVDGGPRRARVLLAPLAPGTTERASYRIPTERRGVLSVGPLEARRSDPLGLAATSRIVAAQTELVVLPTVEALLPLPCTPGDDRRDGSRRATAAGQMGEDFYALRPWVVGEDLRRVHWPSTARRDEMMVRQHDVPSQRRATVLLDVRAGYHDEESLEQAVSAAASIVVSSGQGGALVRLVTTDGGDSGFGAGAAHLDALLDRLARIEAFSGKMPDLPETPGAVAVIVAAEAPAAEVALLAGIGGRPGSRTVVVIGRREGRFPGAAPGRTVLVAPGHALAPAWNRAMASSRMASGTAG